MAKPWFKPKTFGIGISPASWEGWASLAGLVVLMVGERAGARLWIADGTWRAGVSLAANLVTLAGFFVLCTLKGERVWDWRWRWGDDD